ncbi:MAG TPA: hypothetical protein VK612_02435 [Pyrinomonadaceae bacterium]|nr:hypothetical protein [Pyrinomonadaceae bacterium]
MLYGLLALVSAIITVGSIYQYTRSAETKYIVATVVFLIATVALGALFLSGRVNKNEDIHITE